MKRGVKSFLKGYYIKNGKGEGSFRFRKSLNPHSENQYFQRYKYQKNRAVSTVIFGF